MAELESITEDKKQELLTTLQLLKASNPRVTEILEYLKQIQVEINLLHELKAEHRRTFFYLGLNHCRQCRIWTRGQNALRGYRTKLFNELYKLSYGISPWKLLEVECYYFSSKAEVA